MDFVGNKKRKPLECWEQEGKIFLGKKYQDCGEETGRK